MKRYLTLFLALILTIVCVGCSDTKTTVKSATHLIEVVIPAESQ